MRHRKTRFYYYLVDRRRPKDLSDPQLMRRS
jgi:hypothetical protein